MESLSIKKTGKVFLAVALVIFMLVALLGLSMYGHAAATASADGPDLVISAEFSATSATAHTDSTTTVKYYNESTKPLAVNDTFTVTYSFTVNSASFTGAKYLVLTNTGFDIVSVTVGETVISTTKSATVDGVVYTMSNDGKSRIGFDGNGAFIDTEDMSDIVVVYKLTSAIDTYSNATIGIKEGKYSVLGKKLQDVTSNNVAVYVRSTASITTTAADKTYDASAETTSTTFTAAVSTDKPADPAITTVWKTSADAVLGGAPIDAGDYKVTVSTPATNDFEATTYTKSFTISPKAITITADAKTSVYSTTPAALSYTASPIDFYGRDSVTVSYSGAGASISTATTVGSYTITPSADGTGIGNYTVTPVDGTYTVTRHHVAVPTVTIFNNGTTTDTTIAAGTTEEKTFNGKAYTFDYTAASADANSIVPFTAAGGDAITNVGTSTLTLSVNANYYWGAEGVAVDSQDTDAKTFTIKVNKANITVYLHHTAITYRDAAPTTGYTLGDDDEDLLYNEDLSEISLTQSDFSTTYSVGSPVGTYNIAVAASSASRTAIETFLSNYNVSYDGEDLLSVGKLTVTADNTWIAYTDSASVTYDAAAHGIVAVPAKYTMSHSETSAVICDVALSGGDNSNGTQTHVSGNEAAVTLTAVFTLKGDSATDDYGNVITANYTLAEGTQTKDITITRKAINITANNNSITYGDAFANDGVTYGTFAGSETSAVLTGTLAYATDYVAEAENVKRVVGTYYIRPSGLSNNDYAITYVDGVLTVGKKTVSITWSTPNTWTYDGSAHIVTATIGDTEYSETITVAAYDTNTELTNVGSSSRSVTSLSDDDNYAIPENSQAFSVTARTVTVAVTPVSDFTYDSASHTIFTVEVSNLVGTESLTFAYTETGHDASGTSAVYKNGSYTFAGEWADDYTLVFTGISAGVAGDSQTAGAASNYILSADSEKSMTIEKYTFTWAAATPSGNVLTWTAPTTIQTGDSITFAYSLKLSSTEKLASSTALTYTATETGVYTLAVSFSGDEAANYNEIADQTFTVYSVTLNDTSYNNATYGHPNNGAQHAAVVKYAFAGETVPSEADWTVAGYIFEGWYSDVATPSGAFDYTAAVNASATYTARYHVATYKVTYKYKLEGATSWETWKSEVVTTFYTSLETVPSNKWFSNVGWNDAEAMNGATKTILDYTEDRTYYTVYTFAVKNGDVDGSGSISTADATIYRQYNVGGYSITTVASIDAAWAITDVMTEYAFAVPADETYFLQPVSDVDASGEEDANDIFYIVNSQIGNSDYATADASGVVIKLSSVDDTAFSTILAGSLTSVKVNGEVVTYASFEDGVLTLNAALTSGQKLEVIIGRVKYVYTKA